MVSVALAGAESNKVGRPKGPVMREFESLQKLLLSLVQYYLSNKYFYIHLFHLINRARDKYKKIDKKLSKKFSLNINKGDRQRRRSTGLANYAGLRYKNICLILRTDGFLDVKNENFIDMQESSAILDFGSVVKLELKFEEDEFIVKYHKRSYQNLKEIIKQISSNAKVWQHKNGKPQVTYI